MKKIKVNFFLDYGDCFWDASGDEPGSWRVMTDELPLTELARQQLQQFLSEYDQYYSCGCPPSDGWTIADCRRFNRELRRVFALVEAELKNDFLICHWQDELMEDEEQLAEFERRPYEYIQERRAIYYESDGDD